MSESAKTPAEPSERKSGSKKNKKGSARSSSSGSSITFSEGVLTSLKDKVAKQNKKAKQSWQRVSLSTLKAVYRRGAGAFSTSHRPNQNRASWSMARVNAFLKIVNGGGNPKYTQDNDLLKQGHPRKRKKVKKSIPFRIAGQGARREIIDPRNFPPARPIPLYPKPRVNNASQITEDMPISTSQHVQISNVAQHEANFEVASSKIKQVLAGADPFMINVIMTRLRVFYQMNKALEVAQNPYGGGTGNQLAELERLRQKFKRGRAASKKEKEDYERALKAYEEEMQKYIESRSSQSNSYETASATRKRAVETWVKSSSEEDQKTETASARDHLAEKGIELRDSPEENIELALQSGWQPSDDSFLGGFIDKHQEVQSKRNQELMEVAVVSRDEIVTRLKKDRQSEIDNAFGQLPASILSKYSDFNPSKASDREEILLREGYEPISADASKIDENTSPEQLLGMSSSQGLFDGKVGRTHKYETIKNAESWREETYPDIDSSENVSSARRKQSQTSSEDGAPDGESAQGDGGLPEGVIAIGPRGGQIVGYRSNGTPIYRKGTSGGAQPQSAAPAQSSQPEPSTDTFRPVQRRSPVNTTPLNTPTSLSKSLQVAEMLCKSVGLKVDRGRLMKSDDDRLLEALDETYERLAHIRPLLDPHHTSMHNEMVHRLREAHANPSDARVKQVISSVEHFISSVITESERELDHAKEMLGSKPKKGLKKAIVRIGSDGLVVRHPAHDSLVKLARTIDAAEHKVYEHNLDCKDEERIELSSVRKCFARSASLDEAKYRVVNLIALSKGEPAESFDSDLLHPSNDHRLAGLSVADIMALDIEPERALDFIAKGVRTGKDDDDEDHDDDDFEEDQEQLEEEVSEGINPEGEDEEEDEEEKAMKAEMLEGMGAK